VVGEEEMNLQQISEEIERKDIKQAHEDAERLIKANEKREKSEEGLTEHEKFWRDWARTSPPDSLVQREPTNAMSGAIEHGGGSNNSRRKQPAKKMPEYLKTWGL
jgi:hypothetical protein